MSEVCEEGCGMMRVGGFDVDIDRSYAGQTRADLPVSGGRGCMEEKESDGGGYRGCVGVAESKKEMLVSERQNGAGMS